MPYKDPEHKRQWEREHREERNARRRKSSSNDPSEPSGIDAPSPDPQLAQITLGRMGVAAGLVMGLALLLGVIALVRRLAGSSPVSST